MKVQILKALTAVVLFLLPNVNFGQAPDLGAASSFALFTAVGAFDVLGTSTVVTGDVGTDVGALTGFPPGTVLPPYGIYYEGNPFSATVAAAVLDAYDALTAVSCDSALGTPTLGNGQILTPMVYCIGEAATLNDTLYLDGQGDPDALFIFKITGTFATSTSSSKVILINSASLCNVYWQISGEVTLVAGSVFRGTIVGGGAIHVLEGSSLLGRGLTRAGAIDLHNNVVTIGLPPAALSLTGSTICTSPGGNGTITSDTSGIEISYQLYNSSNATVQSAQAGTGSGLTWSTLAAGTGYYVIATNAENCTAISNTVDVATYANPTITTGGTAAAVCYSVSGQTTTLVYTATTNSPTSYSIDWDATANAAGLTDQGNTAFTFISGGGTLTGIAIPAATLAGGPYSGTMTITNANGCTATQAVTVTVNPLPAAAAGADRAICLNASTQIGAAAVTGSTYSWTSSANGWTSTEANPTVTPLVTTTFYVVETITASGCINSNSVIVTVNPLPAAAAGADTTICLNASTQIGAVAVTGSTYSWTSLPAGFTSAEANPTVTPLVTTTYIVVETITATGCQMSNSVTVTVNLCGTTLVPISTWALLLGGALIALFVFVRYRRMV